MQLALHYRGDAFRVVYALKIVMKFGQCMHFQKKSKTGIKTPKADIDLIRER